MTKNLIYFEKLVAFSSSVIEDNSVKLRSEHCMQFTMRAELTWSLDLERFSQSLLFTSGNTDECRCYKNTVLGLEII